MKFKVGDILRSKDDMRITAGKNEDLEEDVEQGDYFIITYYGEFEDVYGDTHIGWTLLSQKNATPSRWDESYCDLNKSFIKV